MWTKRRCPWRCARSSARPSISCRVRGRTDAPQVAGVPRRPAPAAKRAAPAAASPLRRRRCRARIRCASPRHGQPRRVPARRPVARRQTGGNAASSGASTSAAVRDSPRGTTRSTSPMASASLAAHRAAGQDQVQRAALARRGAAGGPCRRRSAARPSAGRTRRTSRHPPPRAGRTRAPARGPPATRVPGDGRDDRLAELEPRPPMGPVASSGAPVGDSSRDGSHPRLPAPGPRRRRTCRRPPTTPRPDGRVLVQGQGSVSQRRSRGRVHGIAGGGTAQDHRADRAMGFDSHCFGHGVSGVNLRAVCRI